MSPSFHASLVNGRFGDPAIFVERLHAREAMLFDLGDLGALSARNLLRVTHVFVSHMHMDHFIGFDALLRVHVGRAKQITLVGPERIAECVGHRLAGYSWDLVHRYDNDLSFRVIELAAAGLVRETRFRLRAGFAAEPLGEKPVLGDVVSETAAFTARAKILEHHGPSLGFAIAEPLHVNIWRNRVVERGLPLGPWLAPLKQAVRDGRGDDHPVQLPDGSAAPLGECRDLLSVEPGQKLGYVTDVRDTAANRRAIAELCEGADTLFIEASFAAADADKAYDRAHLTTRAAGEIAREARARRVEPFHFSPRYEGTEEQLLAEVRGAFKFESR